MRISQETFEEPRAHCLCVYLAWHIYPSTAEEFSEKQTANLGPCGYALKSILIRMVYLTVFVAWCARVAMFLPDPPCITIR